MRPVAIASFALLVAVGAIVAAACRGSATTPDERVAFLRIDRDAAALLVATDEGHGGGGNVWESPNSPRQRPRAERFRSTEAGASGGGAIELYEGALLVAQLPGRILGDVQVELDGEVRGGAAMVRLASLWGPLREIATVDAIGDALLQRVKGQQLEAAWKPGAGGFVAPAVAGDRQTIWLLLSIEVPTGGSVRLDRVRLREQVLPRPDHHSVGAESRLSLPLATGETRRFPLAAVPAGASVAFALAAPEGMAPLAQPLRARCRLEGATPPLQVVELTDGPLADGEPVRRWRDVAFDLERELPAGTALEVTVEGAAERALFVGLPVVEAKRGPATPPNLVLISLDTLRADRVGAMGSDKGLTPNLDRFAERCVRFPRCYSPANFTIPAHGSMMTGLQPAVHGAHRFGERVSIRTWPNVAEACSEAGLATAAFTGGGFVDGAFGFDRGFSRYKMLDALMTPRNPRYTRSPRRAMFEWNRAVRDGMSLAEVTDWLDRHADRASFLFFHTYHAHDYSPEAATAAARQIEPGAPWPIPIDLPVEQFPSIAPGSPQVRHYEALYDATVTEVDAAVGRLLATLQNSGALERSIVVITADHGEGFLEHGFLFHTTGLHDEVVHVPLLIHVPGVEARTVDTPVSLVDLAPTMLELCGLAAPPDLQGTSLVPLLRGEEMEPRPLLIQDCPASGETHSAIVLGRWKYLRWMRFVGPPPADPKQSRPQEIARESLFDLLADPREQHDLAAAPEFAAPLEQARVALDRRLAEIEELAQRFAARRAQGGTIGADLDAELLNLGYGR